MEDNTVFDDLMQALHEVQEYQKGNLKLEERVVEIPDDEIEFYQMYRKLSQTNKKKAKSYVDKLIRGISVKVYAQGNEQYQE